jgi:hypothetical protein
VQRFVHRAAIAALGGLPGCLSAPATPPTTIVVEQPPSDPLTPAERLVALLTEDNPRLEKVAMSLASIGDRPAMHAAGRRLVAIARTIGTPAWRETERTRIQSESDEPASPLAMQAQIEDRETQALTAVLAAMFHVGGPAVADYCLSLADDDTAPIERRLRALRVLDRVVDPADAARIAHRAELAARVRPPMAPFNAGSASAAMVQMRRSLVACYGRALAHDPGFRARIQIKLHVGARGKVTTSIEGDPLPAGLDRCLKDTLSRLVSLDQETPGMEVTVPIVFSNR